MSWLNVLRVLRREAAVASTLTAVAIAVVPAHAQFFDNFETFQPGPVCGQRGWQEWVGSVDVCGQVVPAQGSSGQRALLIVGAQGGQSGLGDDTVQRFDNIVGGKWVFRIMTFVPPTAAGKAYVVLLNTYDDPPGTPIGDYRWSLQVGFNADTNLVEADFNLGTAPLVRGRWAEFRVEIDLDGDSADFFYDGVEFVSNQSWINGVSIGGQPRIQALDLYGGEPMMGGTTGMLFDDVRLHRAVPPSVPSGPRPCPCDWDNNGSVNSQDFFDFLAAFFAGDADFNGDQATNSQDFFDFLACFFAGCPEPVLLAGTRIVGGVHEVYFSLLEGTQRRDIMSCAFDPETHLEDYSTQRLFGMTAEELLTITDPSAGLMLVQASIRPIGQFWEDCEIIPFDGTDAEIAMAKRQSETMDGVTGNSGAGDPAWETNGCTNAPDFDFEDCCNTHDICYCIGGNEDARLACDVALLACITGRGHPALAAVYYAAVRAFGRSFFSFH